MAWIMTVTGTLRCGCQHRYYNDADLYADVDGDGFGDDENLVLQCVSPTGYLLSGGDCNDADPNIHPNADEYCDTLDNDCDGQTGSRFGRCFSLVS